MKPLVNSVRQGAYLRLAVLIVPASQPAPEGGDLPEKGPTRMLEVSFAVKVGGACALAANCLWSVEPKKMRLAHVFVPGGERVKFDTEEEILPKAEEQLARALQKIPVGACDPTPSRHAYSYCPMSGAEIEGCPVEIPI